MRLHSKEIRIRNGNQIHLNSSLARSLNKDSSVRESICIYTSIHLRFVVKLIASITLALKSARFVDAV